MTPEPKRLSSWKEVAAYLQVDVKTAQRWEKQRNLPVHRVPGLQRGLVYADRDEIDRWLTAGASVAQSDRRSTSQFRWFSWKLAVLGLVPVVVFSALFVLGRRDPLARVAIDGRDLIGFDGQDDEIWRFPLESRHVAKPFMKLAGVVDWEGSGRPDAVVAAHYARDDITAGDNEVVCVSGSGQLRWRWRPTSELLDHDGRPFENAWSAREVTVAKTGKGDRLFVSLVNRLRWASGVYELDSKGSPRLLFANQGYVLRMGTVGPAAQSKLVVAGINNAVNRPFIALLGLEDEPSVTPPLSGPPRYRYADAPKGTPHAYVLLPNSEFNLTHGEPYPIPSRLETHGNVTKLEITDPAANVLAYLYEFDEQLRPLTARTSSWTLTLHRTMEQTGALRHSVQDCPELTKPHVLRVWTRGSGWKDVDVPIAHQLNTQ